MEGGGPRPTPTALAPPPRAALLAEQEQRGAGTGAQVEAAGWGPLAAGGEEEGVEDAGADLAAMLASMGIGEPLQELDPLWMPAASESPGRFEAGPALPLLPPSPAEPVREAARQSSAPGLQLAASGVLLPVPLPADTAASAAGAAQSGELQLLPTGQPAAAAAGVEPEALVTAGAAAAEQPDSSCIVCMDRCRKVVLVPCGHIVLCTECARSMYGTEGEGHPAAEECLLCRQKVRALHCSEGRAGEGWGAKHFWGRRGRL